MNRTYFCFAAFAPLLVLAAPVSAEPIVAEGKRAPVRSQTVSYASLDLRNDAAVATLTRRVKSAAKDVCNVPHYNTTLDEAITAKRCFRGSFARAQNDIAVAVDRARNGNRMAGLPTIRVASR